jgi:adenosylmethionine-8-amino-7-oxononanoate aminotransferase
MAKGGVLTRPIGNVIVLMPPYCATADQIGCMVRTMHQSIQQVLPAGASKV